MTNSLYTLLTKQHLYHLVDPSPWPFLLACHIGFAALSLANYMNYFCLGSTGVLYSLICIVAILSSWWRDVIREGTYNNHHSEVVQRSLRLGMLLFIVSEIMFFLAFFWAFFHASLAPTPVLGCVWPPQGIAVLSPYGIPFLNTCILLTSGATVTLAHHTLLCNDTILTKQALSITLILAGFFTCFQIYEYYIALFTIADGVYGSTFYMATGFHGFHVIIGIIFLAVSLIRYNHEHLTVQEHFGFEAAAWYWHFVDVVWLILFVMVYYWGGTNTL